MYIELELESQSSLQPYVRFDWRLVAERGLRCYGHHHRLNYESKTVASCELNFLKKARDPPSIHLKLLSSSTLTNRLSLPPDTRHPATDTRRTNGHQMAQEEEEEEEAKKGQLAKGTKVSLSSATRPAGQFKCVGAVRKAGFLSVKKWILKRRQSIELARKQGWKRYWVCLRGTTLLFYSVLDKKHLSEEEAPNRTCLLAWIQSNCVNEQHWQHLAGAGAGSGSAPRESLAECFIEKEPRHLIIIEGAIAQPIPEHPKRDFVFCLSTTFGDAYLFQSACQLESDNWISAIHNACAASMARDLTRDEATKLFANKIRHLQIEADKKLFLRQRLESRLTSMSSMSHLLTDSGSRQDTDQDSGRPRSSMRSLLLKLSQQLLILDTYIEQVHCEIYQLRCYIASCGSLRTFYQLEQQCSPGQVKVMVGASAAANELPHPKGLLIHVSKPTKLILIKLGVFTVSSFHAYIHARQGSAESILQKIQRPSSSSEQSPTVELRIRSRSLSEQMLSNRLLENVQLENETEKLIDMSNLKRITVKLKRHLYDRIKLSGKCRNDKADGNKVSVSVSASDSDDCYSVQELGELVLVSMRIHPSSNTLKIIKQLLNFIEPNLPEMDFLNYYLRFEAAAAAASSSQSANDKDGDPDTCGKERVYVVKRADTLDDWSADLHSLELVEKIVFRLELTRRQIEEEATPFGISIGVQLFEGKFESLLSVHCSYIEWGSVADKAGLKDDDELLMINGVPVMDLDMMFVETLIQDDTRLRLVVRSSRPEPPTGALPLGSHNWRSPPTGGHRDQQNKEQEPDDYQSSNKLDPISASQTQVISDEYISSLVCPPPPDKASAFFRLDSSLLRQKSDLGSKRVAAKQPMRRQQLDAADAGGLVESKPPESRMFKAKSQHNIDTSPLEDELASVESATRIHLPEEMMLLLLSEPGQQDKTREATNLASQLMRRTEQLTRLLGKAADIDEYGTSTNGLAAESAIKEEQSKANGAAKLLKSKPEGSANALERLRKSIMELVETEFAYIRHLETISEHYMSPLQEMSFLNIADLKHLNETVSCLIEYQRAFFAKLARGFVDSSTDTRMLSKAQDEYEELNSIIQQLDSSKSLSDLVPYLRLISKTFLEEADGFKIYSLYCAAYSRLQRLLHPSKRPLRTASAAIIASPNALDTFLLTNSGTLPPQPGATSIGPASGSSRDFLKPLGSFMSANQSSSSQVNTLVVGSNQESKSQLKQLNEFLGHLDSSSSSVSLSLPRSSASGQQKSNPEPTIAAAPSTTTATTTTTTTATATATATATTFQKSAHQQSFESYLIKPIQRIVKYPMLLNSIALAAAQAQASGDLRESLQMAVKQMESVTSHVNDSQRVQDEFGPLFELIERQFLKQLNDASRPLMGPHQPTISLGVEQLLYSGQVDWLNILEFSSKMKRLTAELTYHLFVFNSCVVFVCKELVKSTADNKKKSSNSMSSFNGSSTRSIGTGKTEIIRYQSLIPVSEVQVRTVPTSGQQTRSRHKYQWELFRCSSVNSNSSLLTNKSNKRSSSNNDGKVYLLASASNEARNLFLRKIRYIIRESVRNMSLPLTRSPSSKSLSPKKIISSSSHTNTSSSCSQSTSLSPVIHDGNEYIERDKSNYATGIEVNN